MQNSKPGNPAADNSDTFHESGCRVLGLYGIKYNTWRLCVQQRLTINFGNDTIDPYPLIPREAKKILIVKQIIFEEISKRFKAFCQYVQDQPEHLKSIVDPFKRKFSGQKKAPTTPAPNLNHKGTNYEPTNIIHLTYTEIRRWRRVNEWFNQYAPAGAEDQIY